MSDDSSVPSVDTWRTDQPQSQPPGRRYFPRYCITEGSSQSDGKRESPDLKRKEEYNEI